jgi:chromosome partitioning protein
MARIIALSNQKGGVGKTTTSMNLSTALAATGKKVLVIDLDPQANSTSGLGVQVDELKGNSYTFLMGQTDLDSARVKTQIPNLDLVPSTIHLSGAEVELVPALAREYKLQKALEPYVSQYDYIFID